MGLRGRTWPEAAHRSTGRSLLDDRAAIEEGRLAFDNTGKLAF
jgi:hypothetical protein